MWDVDVKKRKVYNYQRFRRVALFLKHSVDLISGSDLEIIHYLR